ncbi:hypothetical protein [Cohnella sp. JJ-181]|uniref:hypothetical protein n=1 Tax=Cohnella rhizoplanae TaxID=2974897 RepID=UPI0022FF996C|nr:hypothetical protein [Cohnella sp. JJ-181]CAI6087170.1 hypothetical protein COHCIP112018_05363 [Cohnella sp. JJ-181]
MATLAASMSLYDRFTSKLRSVNEAMQRTINLASQLREAMRSEVTIRINAGEAVAEVERLRTKISAMGSGVLQVLIDSSQVTRELTRIQAQVRSGAAGTALRLNVDTAHLRTQINTAMSGLHHAPLRIDEVVRLDTAGALRQASLLRHQIDARIGSIVARVQLVVNAQLGGFMGDLRSTMDRLIDAIHRLITKLDGSGPGGGGGGGFGGIRGLAGVVSSVLASLGLGTAYKSAVGGAMQQQQTLDTFSARAGSEAAGGAIFDTLTKQALALGQNVDQALSGAMSFMSNTTNPKRLAELSKLSMRLQKLNPFENLEGAAFSMKELLSGDYTSIVERFNIGRAQIKNSDALKAGKAGDIDGFIKGMDKLLNQQNMSEKAFEKMLDSPAAKWQRVLQTFQFRFKQAGQGALNALEPLFDFLNKGFESGRFEPFFKAFETAFWAISKAINVAVHAAVAFGDAMVEYWPFVFAILGAIAYIYIPVITKALWGMVRPILVAVGAFLAANWAVLLVAVAVGGLIYWLKESGVTAAEAAGVIMGSFSMIKLHFENVLISLKNGWISFTDFLHNMMVDPVYAVQKLFFDMAMNFFNLIYEMTVAVEGFAGGLASKIGDAINHVLGGVDKLANALSKIPGFGELGGFTSTKVDTFNPHGLSNYVDTLRSELEKYRPTSDKDVRDTAKIPFKTGKDYIDSFNAGYQKGYNFVGKITDKLEKYDPTKIDSIGKVGEVGKIGDTVDISSEDLKVMRDLAEIKAIQNFVTLTPTVEVTTGPIMKEMDVDEVIIRINRSMEEEIASSAQSVFA